jgi:hypothetical protein
MPNENFAQYFSSLKQSAGQYINNRIDLVKLEATEKVSKIVGILVSGLILGLLAFFVLLFVSIMAGYYFAHLLGGLFAGFSIVAGFYLLLFVAFAVWGRPWLMEKIADTVAGIALDDTTTTSNDITEDNQQSQN